MTHETLMKILGFIAKYDYYGSVFWRTDTTYAPITFLVSAFDGVIEDVANEEDFQILAKAQSDADEAHGEMSSDGILLYCARKMDKIPPIVQKGFYRAAEPSTHTLLRECFND